MNRQHTRLMTWGLLVAVLAAGYGAFLMVYASPRSKLEREIGQVAESIASLDKQLGERKAMEKTRGDLAAKLLAPRPDALEHRFRAGLARAGEQSGLDKVVVDAGTPKGVPSPLLAAKGIQTGLKRELRKQPDFAVLGGSLKGQGSLQQVSMALALLQSQPWVHRVEAVSLRPIGKERDRFEAQFEVSTAFVAGLGPAPEAEIRMASINADVEARAAQFALVNHFRKPPAPAPGIAAAPQIQVAGPTSQAAPAPTFAPYEDWRLTGIAEGRNGPEAFFLNTRTGVRLTVEQGGRVLDAIFVEGTGERAVVEISGSRFEVNNGQTLASRKPRI